MQIVGPPDFSTAGDSSVWELVESLNQILFLMTPDMSRILYVSPAYERVTGYSCKSLYEDARAWSDLIHEDDRPVIDAMVAKRLSGELSGRSEVEFRIRTA